MTAQPPLPLAGRRALVTGAGRGLGRAIAAALAADGAHVIATARTPAELDETVAVIERAGGSAQAVPTDITDPSAVRALRSTAGAVDIVINNAGNLVVRPFVRLPTAEADLPDGIAEPLTFDEWRTTHAVHVDGAFHVLQAFGPDLLARGHGRVVNIVSSALGRTVPFSTAYDSAKAALAQLTRSLAYEWARHGVTVNAVAVGQVKTEMTAAAHEDPRALQWMLRRIPARRVGEPAEVGRFVATLCHDDTGFLTGQIIAFDGGETL